jgi:predicted GIY-YIG superfamily endonuclease
VSERTALYRLYAEDDALLYVGITEHLGTRWHNHARKKPWWPDVQRQTVEWYPTREEAAEAEIKAIQTEYPRHNVTYSVEVLTPEQEAERERRRAHLDEVNRRYEEAVRRRDESKEYFFDVCARQVLAGKDTAETIAARSSFTAVTIRKALRARGVQRLRPGFAARKTRPKGGKTDG